MRLRLVAPILAAMLAFAAISPAAAITEHQWEAQVGRQEYQTLQNKGGILHSSPYYNILNPIAARIAKVADPQYDFPFHFFLVHMSQPNAFAVPGGNVYVTDSLMTFVQNQQELAGVLCHETSHDIHHDVYNLMLKNQRLSVLASLADLLFGGGKNRVVNMVLGIGTQLESLRFSRAVEQNADRKGAFTCAAAGMNPWGMVWLFRRFENTAMASPPEFLSDHPGDAERITALENLFQTYPATFSRFNRNVSSATPLR